MTVIPSYDAAKRVGFRAVETQHAIGFRVFQYEQPNSRLTLFGVALKLPDGGEHEVRRI